MPLVGFAFTRAALNFLGTVPHKRRRQIIKKAKALHTIPFPPGVKKLQGVQTDTGEPVYRQRAGDFRILYVVLSKPAEVLILDIANRKDVYKMPKTKTKTDDEMRMSEGEFDTMMGDALGVASPPEKTAKSKAKNEPSAAKRQAQ